MPGNFFGLQDVQVKGWSPPRSRQLLLVQTAVVFRIFESKDMRNPLS